MDFFPVFLDLRGRVVLVLGEGPAAARKAALARRAGASVRSARAFSPALLDSAALAIGAGAAEEDLSALAASARARGIPVNILDRPELCTAIMPAFVDRAPIMIAISSGGAAPVLARLIRAWIAARLSPRIGRLAALAARLRAETVQRLPDLNARRRALEQAFTGVIAERVFAGDEAGAEAEYRALLARGAESPAPATQVFFVRAAEADRLTLRAARLLGSADAVVHAAEVGADVIDLARLEAERIIAGPDVAERLVTLARRGKLVVRVSIDDDARERAALAAAGIASVTLPSVP